MGVYIYKLVQTGKNKCRYCQIFSNVAHSCPFVDYTIRPGLCNVIPQNYQMDADKYCLTKTGEVKTIPTAKLA